MDNPIKFEQIPDNYLMCTHNACTQCNNCLRYQAYLSLPATEPHFRAVNPQFVAAQPEGCPYFRHAEKVRYAKGFIGILNSLPVATWKSVTSKLEYLYNGRNYYRYRKGEKLLPPEEQKRIVALIRQHGVNTLPDFDAYVEDYVW